MRPLTPATAAAAASACIWRVEFGLRPGASEAFDALRRTELGATCRPTLRSFVVTSPRAKAADVDKLLFSTACSSRWPLASFASAAGSGGRSDDDTAPGGQRWNANLTPSPDASPVGLFRIAGNALAGLDGRWRKGAASGSGVLNAQVANSGTTRNVAARVDVASAFDRLVFVCCWSQTMASDAVGDAGPEIPEIELKDADGARGD